MNNKAIAGCLTVSFLFLFVAEYVGEFTDTLYSAGALGSLIFGILAIRELNNRNKKAWFPYLYVVITAIFWAAAFTDSEILSSLGLVYLAAGLIAVVDLLRKKRNLTESSGASPIMSERSSALDRAQKTSLILGVLIASLALAYYLVIFLPQKESARVEQQKQAQEDQETKEKAAIAQKQKEYIASRKNDCYQIYTKERSAYSNVESVEYDDIRDVCVAIYRSNDLKRSEKECDKILENINDTTDDSSQQLILRAHTNCLNNTTSQDF